METNNMEDYYNYFGLSQDDVNLCRKRENEFYLKIESFKTYEEKMNFKYELYTKLIYFL